MFSCICYIQIQLYLLNFYTTISAQFEYNYICSIYIQLYLPNLYTAISVNYMYIYICSITVQLVQFSQFSPAIIQISCHIIIYIVSVFLQHWVNSILTYCKVISGEIPQILFVATHKDKISEVVLTKIIRLLLLHSDFISIILQVIFVNQL